MRYRRFLIGWALIAAVAAPLAQDKPTESLYTPKGTRTELGLAGFAKILCSAVFVSGRDAAEAARNSAYFFLPRDQQDKATWTVNTNAKLVRARIAAAGAGQEDVVREARFYGDQGCVIQQPGRAGVAFRPVPVKTALPDAATQDWPMGDRNATAAAPTGIDAAKLKAATDAAFADPAALTAGFLILHKGRIVAERYMDGITKDTQLESWSMGKSITATLFALLVRDGTYTIEQPAPVDLWHQVAGDPRAKIRNVDLLRMSSGLKFIAEQDPDYTPDKGYPDHFYIYTGAVNAFDYTISQPVQFDANTEGRYRNSDPLTLGYLVKQAVQKRNEEYLTWPQRALFDKIGIRRQVLETDPFGNFLLTGYDYGTPRNWARLGLLYLQDGMWQGTRLLPEGWAKFVSTLAPAWKRPVYGAQFWINGDGAWNLPREAYFAAGAGGQNTFIVPSHQLVIVRMGHMRGAQVARARTNEALKLVMESVDPSWRPK